VARLQAHRGRRQSRQSASAHPSLPGFNPDESQARTTNRAASVAAAVAERYAAATSYSEYLSTLSTPPPEQFFDEQVPLDLNADDFDAPHSDADSPNREHAHHDLPTQGSSALEFQQDFSTAVACEPRVSSSPLATAVFPPELASEFAAHPLQTNQSAPPSHEHSDNFFVDSTVEPNLPLAANLIEFPRQLIAARKARPRLAEGPLRESPTDSAAVAPENAQLRIFEVEPEQISREPLAAQPAAALPVADWHYIQLDTPLLSTTTANIATDSFANPFANNFDSPFDLPMQPAPMDRRMLAASLDLGLILVGFFIFMAGFATITRPPSDKFAFIAASAIFLALSAAYQWLFLTYSDATPGMRYARIALCTFGDSNPTVANRRGRIAAFYFSAAAAGLGFLWMLLDVDHLGWHDRISKTYQRCY